MLIVFVLNLKDVLNYTNFLGTMHIVAYKVTMYNIYYTVILIVTCTDQPQFMLHWRLDDYRLHPFWLDDSPGK